MVAIYIFFQQLGSILGLILGGYITDGIGWRWSQPIVAISCVSLDCPDLYPRYRS
jgi:MFS family permease